MKGTNFSGVRGKQMFLTVTVIFCTSILIWSWERTPLIGTISSSQEQFDIRNPVSHLEDLVNDRAIDEHLRSHKERVPLNLTFEKTSSPGDVEGISPVGAVAGSYHGKDKRSDGLEGTHSEEKECNFAKGKWIVDNIHPLYSGFECKQWLSEMWACRLMQRTDFSYEGFSWQPENCEMPGFQSSAILKRMKDKTIALVGDSLGRQQFQSMMCMLTGGKEGLDIQDVGSEYGLVKALGAIRPDGWAFRFPSTNTTVLYYWSASLCELEPLNITNPRTSYAMHLDRPAWFLKQNLHKFNVLVLNTGHHWNRGKLNANRWEMYVGGVPLKDMKLAMIANAKNFVVNSVVKWLDSQLPQYPSLRAFFRTISPRHFVNGDWNTGGSCDNTIPLAGGSQVLQDGSSDAAAEAAVKGTRVKLLDITALSQLRDEGHISKYSVKAADGVHDCLHWCLPGIPDTWNEILFAQL